MRRRSDPCIGKRRSSSSGFRSASLPPRFLDSGKWTCTCVDAPTLNGQILGRPPWPLRACMHGPERHANRSTAPSTNSTLKSPRMYLKFGGGEAGEGRDLVGLVVF
jgi:hypothetical protein